MKTAIQLPVVSPLSLEFGGMTTIERKILFPEGSILPYLPNWEGQSMTYGDTWGCVGHSMENGFQVITIRQFDDYRKENQDWLKENYELNKVIDYSDRDLVVLSGTKAGVGNSGQRVLETAQLRGLISQTLGDWDMFSREPTFTIENYYNYVRTTKGEKLAKEWKDRMEVKGEWVTRDKWEEASKEGVLQIYVNAWFIDENGKYYNPNGRHNHAVIIADYKNNKILDTYKPEIKELRSWNDAYYLALKLNITEKPMEKPKIENNTLLQEVEQSGQFGLFLDDKIIVGEAGQILATFYMRNNGDTKGKTRALTLSDWNKFDKYNLKMEKI